MQNPFEGSWRLNTEKSQFDANHRPSVGRMVFEVTAEGHYLLSAEGVNAKGEACRERPQRMVPDGKAYPVPDFPGLSATTSCPDANTIAAEVRREDGSVVGGGRYVVSQDGQSLTATNFGFDSQLRQFEQKTVWDRA
jgi:hypothetical protein